MTSVKTIAATSEAAGSSDEQAGFLSRSSETGRIRHVWLVNKRQELLEPVHAILEVGAMLIRDAQEREHVSFLTDLQQIHASGSNLHAMLVDLLDFTKSGIEETEFARRIRHDLRTPLTHVIGLCELWLEDAQEQMLAGFVEDLGRIHQLSKALLVSINDVLRFGEQAGDQDMALPDVDLSGAMQNLASNHAAPRADETGKLLVVDDNPINRDLLCRCLGRMGHHMTAVPDGIQALQMLRSRPSDFDLILLDIIMPELNGFQVLERLKADEHLRAIPVIVISAFDDIDGVARCIEMGAEDYLAKPFNRVVLRARINASLEKKRRLEEIDKERRRADGLLHVILPGEVVKELKETSTVRPRRYENVAVLFSDIVGFTPYCDRNGPENVVSSLQDLIEKWEESALRHGVQKIKTIGDAFMAASGLLQPTENPVLNCVRCGLEMIEACQQMPTGWDLRVGIHVGPVVAGVIGRRQYLYDLWGDTVNTAARMESHGVPGSVVLSGPAWQTIAPVARGESRGIATVKGKGQMELVRFAGFLPS